MGDADAAVIQEDDQRAAHQQEAYDDSDPEGFHLRLPSRHFPICLSLQQFSSALHTHAEVQPSIAHQSDDPGADREDKGFPEGKQEGHSQTGQQSCQSTSGVPSFLQQAAHRWNRQLDHPAERQKRRLKNRR